MRLLTMTFATALSLAAALAAADERTPVAELDHMPELPGFIGETLREENSPPRKPREDADEGDPGSEGARATRPLECPPGQPKARLGLWVGCRQADGSLRTAKGFLIRLPPASPAQNLRRTAAAASEGSPVLRTSPAVLRRGGPATKLQRYSLRPATIFRNAAGQAVLVAGVEMQAPAGSPARRLTSLAKDLEASAQNFQRQAKAPDAGLEAPSLRGAAGFEQRAADAMQALDTNSPLSAAPDIPEVKAAGPALENRVQVWCRDMLPKAIAAEAAFKKSSKRADQPPPPEPPSTDFMDCFGCDKAAQDRHYREAQAWFEGPWARYRQEDVEAIRTSIEYNKQREQLDGYDKAFYPRLAAPGTACAALEAQATHLKPYPDDTILTPVITHALNRLDAKMFRLGKAYGKDSKPGNYLSLLLAGLDNAKQAALLRCDPDSSVELAAEYGLFKMEHLIQDWKKRMESEHDYRALTLFPFLMSMEREIELLSSQVSPLAYDERVRRFVRRMRFQPEFDFTFKLGGMDVDAQGYALARVRNKPERPSYDESSGETWRGLLYAAIDPDNPKCGLLESAEYDAQRLNIRPAKVSFTVEYGELLGTDFRARYLGPVTFKSQVVVDLACCDRTRPRDTATIYIEALGAQMARGERERWSEPSLNGVNQIDAWLRTVFGLVKLKQLAEDAGARAEAAAVGGEMQRQLAEMKDLQSRYERGEASLGDVVAAARKLQGSMSGTVGNGSELLKLAQHHVFEVPFRNRQRAAIDTRLDARQLAAQAGGETARDLLDKLQYGFAAIRLTHTVKPAVVGPPEKNS